MDTDRVSVGERKNSQSHANPPRRKEIFWRDYPSAVAEHACCLRS